MQTIWVVEFEPIPPHSVGGWDWFFSFDKALLKFMEYKIDAGSWKLNTSPSHQIGLYSILLPAEWDVKHIQTWLEDNTCVLPKLSESPEHT